MNEISIPYHLLIPTIVSLSLLTFIIILRKKLFKNIKLKWFWITIGLFCIVYALIVGGATIADLQYQYDLNQFDLDKDGFFSIQESTKEQQIAMNKLTSDVGRNFSFIFGLIISGIFSFPLYFIGLWFEKYKEARKEEMK